MMIGSRPAGSSSRVGSKPPWPASSAVPPRPVSIRLGTWEPSLRLAVWSLPPEGWPLAARTRKLPSPKRPWSSSMPQTTLNLAGPMAFLRVRV
jgi:hypothetical protein